MRYCYVYSRKMIEDGDVKQHRVERIGNFTPTCFPVIPWQMTLVCLLMITAGLVTSAAKERVETIIHEGLCASNEVATRTERNMLMADDLVVEQREEWGACLLSQVTTLPTPRRRRLMVSRRPRGVVAVFEVSPTTKRPFLVIFLSSVDSTGRVRMAEDYENMHLKDLWGMS